MKDLFAVIGLITAAVILLAVIIVPLAWIVCVKQADIYNKFCQPITEVTASDIFWSNLSASNCNIKLHGGA